MRCQVSRHVNAAQASGLAAFLVLLNACAEQPTAVQEPASQLPSLQPVDRTVEVEVVDRFHLVIRATGAFRPGTPIEITVDAGANLTTDAVQLRVTVPEIELAKLTSWGDGFSYETDRVLPAALATQPAHMDRGETTSETTVVTPLAPGYYRAVATINSTITQPLTHEGRWIRNSAVAEVWLLVTDVGGEWTAEFDRARIPDGQRQQPGPFKRQTGQRRDPGGQQQGQTRGRGPYAEDASGPSATVAAGAMTPDVITFRAIYWNVEASAYQPVPSALYQLDGCTVPEYAFVCYPDDWHQIAWGASDQSGYFYFLGCEGSDVDEYQANLLTYAGSNNFQVLGGWSYQAGQVAVDCGGSFDMVLPSSHARVFLNMRKTTEGTVSLFGMSRSFININIAGCGTSYYSPSADEITICTNSVWDDYGIFTVAHEYGHAFHQETLWGNVGGGCPSPHFLDTESGLTCAFSEGFGDYFGVAVRPDLGGYSYRDYIENDDGFPGCVQRQSSSPYTCIGGTSYEGSVIESAYAAFLYDLTDHVGESHDSISAPGSYVRDLIRSCQVPYFLGWRRANGPDEIAYCAENGINPGAYFTRRGSYPSSYSEAATESGGWTSSRVHSSWVWNMYEKP